MSERTIGLFASFRQQWTDLFRRCNWYDFTVIQLQVEYSPYSDRWELDAGLLGVTMNLQYVYADRFNAEMRERIAACEATKLSFETETQVGAETLGDPEE
jgi:hypothetical protein